MTENTQTRPRPKMVLTLVMIATITIASLVLSNSLRLSVNIASKTVIPIYIAEESIQRQPVNGNESDSRAQTSNCALLFFGLPRAFASLTLPSLRVNVLPYNTDCHVYVHFYQQEREAAGRAGQGGSIDPDEIYQLKEYVQKIHFRGETEEQFWEQRRDILHKIRNTKDNNGNLLYMPWKEKSFRKDSAINIIKMWHSIESVWNLATEHAQKEGIHYDTIAVMRSDVVYVNPLRLDEYASSSNVVVPGFAKFPVNDRLIYGASEGVRIWASQRFSRMDEHVLASEDGYGIHDERFLNRTIFPAIEQTLKNDNAIFDHPELCFLRARVDETIWINDCDRNALPTITEKVGNMKKLVGLVETAIGRRCHSPPRKFNNQVTYLNCSLT